MELNLPSFIAGFIVGILFVWLVGRVRPLLKQLGDDSRKDEGNVRYEVWQQTSRPNHFTVVEIWKNQQAFEAHTMATHTRQFREQLQPMSGSLYDERLYQVLD